MYGRLVRGVKSLIAICRGGRAHSIFHFPLLAPLGGSSVKSTGIARARLTSVLHLSHSKPSQQTNAPNWFYYALLKQNNNKSKKSCTDTRLYFSSKAISIPSYCKALLTPIFVSVEFGYPRGWARLWSWLHQFKPKINSHAVKELFVHG